MKKFLLRNTVSFLLIGQLLPTPAAAQQRPLTDAEFELQWAENHPVVCERPVAAPPEDAASLGISFKIGPLMSPPQPCLTRQARR